MLDELKRFSEQTLENDAAGGFAKAQAKITLAAIEDAQRYGKDENGLLPCPFCEGEDIRFSLKVANRCTGNDYVLWHGTMYCNDCNAYGKRVLCRSTEKYRPSDVEKGNFENYAAVAWNTRIIPAAVRAVLEVTGGGE